MVKRKALTTNTSKWEMNSIFGDASGVCFKTWTRNTWNLKGNISRRNQHTQKFNACFYYNLENVELQMLFLNEENILRLISNCNGNLLKYIGCSEAELRI